jgi:hypothetical protein
MQVKHGAISLRYLVVGQIYPESQNLLKKFPNAEYNDNENVVFCTALQVQSMGRKYRRTDSRKLTDNIRNCFVK